MTNHDLHSQVITWRKAEDKFYQSALSSPELYTDGVRLVRAIANSLQQVNQPEVLVEAYLGYELDQIGVMADELALSRADFLDFELALQAAFYLRYQEILRVQDEVDLQTRLGQARAQRAEWVTLYDYETQRQGRVFFQKLEMRLSDGLGLYTAVELDYERGRIYVLEPLQLDPATGDPLRGVAPPTPRQEFRTREELTMAVAKLRDKHSNE